MRGEKTQKGENIVVKNDNKSEAREEDNKIILKNETHR